MLTSKQRAFLRGQASTLDTLLMVGKDGVTENVVKQAEDLLTARELFKGKVLDNSLLSAREVCETLAQATGADAVCAVGSKYVLYRESKKLPKEKRIQLP